MEAPFTKDQLEFIERYRKGKKFLMHEFADIDAKLRTEDGQGLNLKAIDEKIQEDAVIKKL